MMSIPPPQGGLSLRDINHICLQRDHGAPGSKAALAG